MVNVKVKLLSKTKKEPVTQKARGMWRLLRKDKLTNPCKLLKIPGYVFLVVNSEDECDGKPLEVNGKDTWEEISKFLKFKDIFGRPCPKNPRHGFLESLKLRDKEHFIEVFAKTLEVDSEAEMLLMEMIDAKASAIYVPESGALIVGKGHDGATSGSHSAMLPVCTSKIDCTFRDESGIHPDEHVYFEIVGSNEGAFVVQARSGLPIPVGVRNYIPKKMQVQNIIEPTDDLLAWEALCKALKGSEGIVAKQIGGSLGSHPAIHCRSNEIPYLTYDVQIGDWIEPSEVGAPPFDPVKFAEGLALTEKTSADASEDTIAPSLNLAIALMHNLIPLEYSEQYSKLFGYSIGWIFRAAAIACIGESRHYKYKNDFKQDQRHVVYQKCLNWSNEDLCKYLATFSYRFVQQDWPASYGGWRWFVALVQTVKLWNQITSGQRLEALETANKILNLAHNGGWLLNKFTSQTVMNNAQNTPGEFLASMVVPLWGVVDSKVDPIMVKPRKYRGSAKWKVSISAVYGQKVQIHINKLVWAPLNSIDPEFISVMQDVYANI